MLPRRSVLLYCAIFARDVGLECLPSVVVARKWIGSSTCARTRIFISGQVTEKCLKCISCFISATCKKSDKSLCLPLGDTIRASRVTRTRSAEAPQAAMKSFRCFETNAREVRLTTSLVPDLRQPNFNNIVAVKVKFVC